MKAILYTVILCVVMCAAACGKENSSAQDTPANPPASSGSAASASPEPPQPPTETQPAPPATPPPSVEQLGAQVPPQTPAPKVPVFFDASKRQIKDLPTFPRFATSDLRFGPTPGGEMVMINGIVRGKFEDVVAFYDKAIKSNKWDIYFNTRDPGEVVWKMTKGAADEAIVAVKIDKVTNQVQLGISRGRKSAGESK